MTHRYVVSLLIVAEVECERADVRETINERLAALDGTASLHGTLVWADLADSSHLTVHHSKYCEVPE